MVANGKSIDNKLMRMSPCIIFSSTKQFDVIILDQWITIVDCDLKSSIKGQNYHDLVMTIFDFVWKKIQLQNTQK